MDRRLLEELREALKALIVLVVALTILYRLATDLPLAPFIVGEVIGCLLGLGLLVIASPRRRLP